MKNYIYKKLPDGRYLQIEDDGKKAALEHFGVEALIEGLQTGKMSIPEGFVKKLNDGRYLDISNDAIQSEFQKVYGALQGLNGSSGSSGMSGTSGTSGVSGTSGTSGINGVDGQNGINGIDGTSGTSGISGTSGVDGLDGINGIDGSSGTSGISGSNGSSGSSGASGTSGTSGVNGLAGSSGTSGISIVGATGATGPAGRDGKPGQSGGRGPMGPMGLQGPKGDKGDPGSGGASIPRFITSSYSITRANEAMVHDLYIKDQLTIEAGTYSYDFGSASFIDNALLDVEETIWLDGVLEVNGEMNIGDVVGSSGGGSGTSGSSGSSGTSGVSYQPSFSSIELELYSTSQNFYSGSPATSGWRKIFGTSSSNFSSSDFSNSNMRITYIGGTGKTFSANLNFYLSGSSTMAIGISKNSAVPTKFQRGVTPVVGSVNDVVYLSNGDYIEPYVFSSGTVSISPNNCDLTIQSIT